MKNLPLLALASSLVVVGSASAADAQDTHTRFGLQANALMNLGAGPTFIVAKPHSAFGTGLLFRGHETSFIGFAEWRKTLVSKMVFGVGANYTHSTTRRTTASDYSTIGARVSLTVDLGGGIDAGLWVSPYTYSSASFDSDDQIFRRGGLSLTFYY